MKLLVITQKIDKQAPILGFFHGWVEAFAKEFSWVSVICLEKGEYDLPENVAVYSLGKESGGSRLQYLKNFYTYIFCLRNEYDSVFIHMNQKYVFLGSLLWRLWGKKVLFWKAHGHLSWDAKFASLFSHKIITSSVKGYDVDTPKKIIVGQGIDTDFFFPNMSSNEEEFSLLSVGRLSPVKHIEDLIEAVSLLKEKIKIRTVVVGPDSNPEYVVDIKKLVEEKGVGDVVNFIGPVSQEEMPDLYCSADVLVNNSDTDSLDKVVFEAMACGTIPITCNQAFQEILKDKGLFVPKRDIKALIEAIIRVQQMSAEERGELAQDLRSIVVGNHSLKHLAKQVYEHATK